MKIKRIRRKILEISEAQFLLRDKLAALSLSSNTEDEIQRIVRQSFAGSIIEPTGPHNSKNLYCSSAEVQSFKEDTNKVIDTDFSTLLELPSFPLVKNSETQVSITPSGYGSLNRNGEGTKEGSQIENFTTSSAISQKRNHQVSFKNSTQTTSNRVESNRTKLGPTEYCKLNQASSPLGGKKIGQMTRGNRAENTVESPVKGIEKMSENKFGLEAEKPQYRVLITSASRKLILPEPYITPSSSTKVLPEKESVPKQIMLKDKENRVIQCFGARLKTARISRDLPNESSHITLKTLLGQYSSPSFSCCPSPTVQQLNRVESSKNQTYPFLTLSSQYFEGPIETSDCILSVSCQECRKSILQPQTLNLFDTRSATKREETSKKCDCPDSLLKGYGSTPLMKRSIKMQHLVDDKKMRENETNVIKCSAQLFQGPIDNADFLVNIIHPTDHYEKIVPQTIINYSKGHIIPIQSVEECRKNDEYSTSKGEDIVKYPEGFEASQNTITEKKSQICTFIPENILLNSGKDDASFLLTWEKSTLSDLTIIESAHAPNDNLEIKEDVLKSSTSTKNTNSEYLTFQKSICATPFDNDKKMQVVQSMPLKRSLFPREGENEIEESKVLNLCAAVESFEILNTSTTFSYELKKTCIEEELCPKMAELSILQGNDEFCQKVDQYEKTEQRLPESLEPSNISLSQFQDSSAFFKMHTVPGMLTSRIIDSETSRDCSPVSQSQQLSPSNEIFLCETVDGSYTNCTEARYSPTSTYVGTAVAESTVGSELRPIELPPEIFNSRSRRLLRLNGAL